MARSTSGYQPLSQAEEHVSDGEAAEDDVPFPQPPTRGIRRANRPVSIDLHKLDTAFKRWTESIAQKMKRKKKVESSSKRSEIWRSVFEPTVAPVSNVSGPVKSLDHKSPMTHADFEAAVIGPVREAIAEGIHPKMITKGSSGSYFARAKTADGRVHTVAVFKPKDEEPYGRLNPKTTKWIHRQFRWIIPFGRACLIPNLSYISEAAASLLDERLDLHIVPRTQLVSLSSPAFFYDWIDRTAAKKGKTLPDKIGSMQYFLNGYQDASEFLRKHPWPGRTIADTFDDTNHRRKGVSGRIMGALKVICGRTGEVEDIYEDYDDERLYDATEDDSSRPFYWSKNLQLSFREELEKLVILDYLMLNTDRGADNYMIKYCEGDHDKSLVDIAPSRSATLEMKMAERLKGSPRMEVPAAYNTGLGSASGSSTPSGGDYTKRPHIHIAAIDNSLSFPHEHPQGWRSYTYGWLYLPVSIIGRPFSQRTRDHFLPLLTSKSWWEETIYKLRLIHEVDPDFNLKFFKRQMSVVKGQAWNIVQALRHSDEGPLELTRRTPCVVHDDELELMDEDLDGGAAEPLASSRVSISTMPLPPRRQRSGSAGDFPPPPMMARSSTDASGALRPVPLASKFQRLHPGTTGVTVLEHLERLDAVEASLQRLTVDGTVQEEEDVADITTKPKPIPKVKVEDSGPRQPSTSASPLLSPPASPPQVLSTLHEARETPSTRSSLSVEEEDLVAMSKSTPHAMTGPLSAGISSAWENGENRGMEWLQQHDSADSKRTVIVERLETIHKRPLCSCW